MPFPDSGKKVQLLSCPTCMNKGLLWFYSPTEYAYQTRCIKCGVRAAIKTTERTFRELEHMGGFTPQLDTIRPHKGHYDATKFYDQALDLHDIGYKRQYRLGVVPRVADKL